MVPHEGRDDDRASGEDGFDVVKVHEKMSQRGNNNGALRFDDVVLGPDRLLGASCYDRLDLALQAAAAGVDYVAFGAAFPSPTKPAAVHAPLALYAAAHRALTVPIVAIGGITLQNAREVIDAGAAAVAVISALFAAEDVTARARAFQQLFTRSA